MQISNPITRARSAAQGWFAGLIAFFLLIGVHFSGALGRLENLAQDELRRRLAQDYVSPIEIVFLDDVSLSEAEKQYDVSFPWPRETYGQAVQFLKRAGAKAVVFDFLFTSKSIKGLDDDQILAKAMRSHGKVIVGMQFTASIQEEGRADFARQAPLHHLDLATGLDLPNMGGVDAPKPPLWEAAAGVGDVNFATDNDGMARHTNLFLRLDDKVYPNMALSAAIQVLDKPRLSFTNGQLNLGGVIIPVDDQGRLEILMRKPRGQGSSTRLLDVAVSELKMREGEPPTLPLARFKDKIVLIGASAPGLRDLRPTPLDARLPGVELHAMVLDNLLTGQALTRVEAGWRTWALLLLLCLFLARFSFALKGVLVGAPGVLAIIASAVLAAWAYDEQHVLLPVAAPMLASLLAFAVGGVDNYLAEQAQRKRVQSMFGQFLSPAVLRTLRGGGGKLDMGGETRELTVFFSDLAGFTSFSEKLSPHALVGILNEYLEEMAEVVVGRHDGYVDKYIGDAIMAFWNAPALQSDHALRACRAAWQSQQRLAQIQKKLSLMGLDAGDEGLVMRIGINTGPAVVGLMGSQRKLNYTVMGDTVNTASRLEGANKPYGSRIMIADSTHKAAGDQVLVRTLDLLRVKGKAEPTPVFELIGIQGEGEALYTLSYVKDWEWAMQLYRQGSFAKAKAAFEALLGQQAKDSVARLYVERCEHFIHEAPEHWDGVYVMKTK